MSARVGTFSYRKDFAIQQFQTIWHDAFDALRQSDGWLFIGYSMPEADFEFRQTLKSAELANRGGRRRSIHVVLKDDQDAAKRYTRYFALSHNQIHQQGLSEFVEPGFQEWLKALGQAL
jgi:alkanesulfonate monooxygenase SsuD/methylene tetrahydromethanopterin reductase-like flavin-dependent oxidoreductase (luciferase family)